MQNYYPNQLLRRLGQAMRDREDDFANQPLPKRWVDLIVHLNEREQAERKGSPDPTERSIPQSK